MQVEYGAFPAGLTTISCVGNLAARSPAFTEKNDQTIAE
jgi:hypothetical protein